MLVNAKILIIALIITVWLVIINRNPDLFGASVLLMQDRQTIIDNKRDIWYKNSNNLLDVFISESLKDFEIVLFSVTYDSENILPDLNNIESQLKYEIDKQWPDWFSIKLVSSTWLDYGQSLFTIPFSGSNPYILISDGTAILNNWWETPLAIWNLDEDKTFHND